MDSVGTGVYSSQSIPSLTSGECRRLSGIVNQTTDRLRKWSTYIRIQSYQSAPVLYQSISHQYYMVRKRNIPYHLRYTLKCEYEE